MDQNQGIKAWQWVVTVIVIIILIIIGYYFFKGSGAQTPASQTPVTSTTTDMTDNVNRVVVSDQYPGNVVYITSAQFATPGFVVIQKDNKGAPGAVIGSEYFAAGINPGKITLSQNTVDGGLYYAVMYTDNGDQKFDATTDQPLEDANGNAILKTFHATTNVTEVKG